MRKYRSGLRYVSACTTAGMLSMGKTKPLSMKKGRMKKKVVIMACCWVAEMVEMKRPIPSVLSRNRQAAKNSSPTLPARGILNQAMAAMMTAASCTSDMMV